jgi:F0F1-type ATP synthase membrane subunit b/b'
MDGTLRNFHLEAAGEKIEYAFQGAIADGGFDIDGIFTPSADHPIGHQSLRFDSIPLQLFPPVISTGFDISPEGATFDLTMRYTAEEKNQSATIGINNLKATDSGSTTAFTIALLSEQKNRLSTVIPLKSPEQPLHSQIRNHFQKLMVKCSVSPYLLLEKPFNGLHEKTQLLFAPGQSVLSAKSKSILQDFAALLKNRPHLKLLFKAVVQRSADARVLRQHLMEQEKERVRKANQKLLQQWQQQASENDGAAPDDTIAAEDIKEEELNAFTPATAQNIVVTDDMLNQLAHERTEQIHRFLVEQQSLPADAIGDLQTVSFIDTLDLPEIEILLSHDQATHTVPDN